MDLLKAEIERKRRAVAEASKSVTDSNKNDRIGSTKKRYLKASELRALEERQIEQQEEVALRDRQRRKQKKRRRNNGDDSDEGEAEDLQTLLTKSYHVDRKRKENSRISSSGGKGKDDLGNGGDGAIGRSGSDEYQPGAGILQTDGNKIPDSLKKMSPKEVTNALRSFGLPVRLFGETTTGDNGKDDDTARLTRLFTAMQGREAAMLGESEKDEFALGSEYMTRNIFLERGNDDEEEQQHLHDSKPSGKSRETQQHLDNSTGNDATTKKSTPVPMTAEEQNDPPKRIYRYFKTLLRQWEDDLSHRPDALRRTAAGKNETKTLKQCKDYIRPLFQLCKSRQLEPDLQNHLFKIVTFCEEGEFVKAHDSYVDVAIGRAAWPIGVTMVGIHARSGRAKIESSNVAHVMNSEMHRKYLTSVKRLMSYAQRKRPDVGPSKKVMNL